MIFPAIDDTIVAVSSGWEARPLGIVRLSGPESFTLAAALGAPPIVSQGEGRPRWCECRLRIAETTLPALVHWFFRPRSYTGQDLVELHTVGCLPLLRETCAALINQGARRALPGEFTARAYLNGRLNPDQVEDVLAAITAGSAGMRRHKQRERRAARDALLAGLCADLADLLSRVEAGIDFVEEEDIRFVTAGELRASLEEVRQKLAACCQGEQYAPRAGRPHVALAGLPNAGKSTLFNALVGSDRAIVSPVLGTTRDVLSAEVELGGVALVLQDCAGLGQSADELEAAAHLAAETAAQQADVVLWVHAFGTAWEPDELRALTRIDATRRLLVWSKTDLTVSWPNAGAPIRFAAQVRTSGLTGAGLSELGEALSRLVSERLSTADIAATVESAAVAGAALVRASELVAVGGGEVRLPEVVALELRMAYEALSGTAHGDSIEGVLGRIYSQFCVGK
jgi:tRNA modification GTPase